MKPQKPNAYLYIDVLIAIVIVITLTAMTTYSLIEHNKFQTQFAHTRQAQHIAQRVLTDLQLNQQTLTPAPDTLIGIENLTGGYQPHNQQWVRITIQHHNQTATLIGLTSTLQPEDQQ